MPVVLIDSTTLGVLTNPANKTEPIQCASWMKSLVSEGILLAVSAVIEYEHKRELIFTGSSSSLKKLESLGQYIAYAPLEAFSSEQKVWQKAAELWAWARKTGQQTSHEHRIDIDVLLAAHSIILAEEMQEHVVIATDNIGHLVRYNVPARRWQDITVEYCRNPKAAAPAELVAQTKKRTI